MFFFFFLFIFHGKSVTSVCVVRDESECGKIYCPDHGNNICIKLEKFSENLFDQGKDLTLWTYTDFILDSNESKILNLDQIYSNSLKIISNKQNCYMKVFCIGNTSFLADITFINISIDTEFIWGGNLTLYNSTILKNECKTITIATADSLYLPFASLQYLYEVFTSHLYLTYDGRPLNNIHTTLEPSVDNISILTMKDDFAFSFQGLNIVIEVPSYNYSLALTSSINTMYTIKNNYADNLTLYISSLFISTTLTNTLLQFDIEKSCNIVFPISSWNIGVIKDIIINQHPGTQCTYTFDCEDIPLSMNLTNCSSIFKTSANSVGCRGTIRLYDTNLYFDSILTDRQSLFHLHSIILNNSSMKIDPKVYPTCILSSYSGLNYVNGSIYCTGIVLYNLSQLHLDNVTIFELTSISFKLNYDQASSLFINTIHVDKPPANSNGILTISASWAQDKQLEDPTIDDTILLTINNKGDIKDAVVDTSRLPFYFENYSYTFYGRTMHSENNGVCCTLFVKLLGTGSLSRHFCIVENNSYIQKCPKSSFILFKENTSQIQNYAPHVNNPLRIDLAGNFSVDIYNLTTISDNITIQGITEFSNNVYLHDSLYAVLNLSNIVLHYDGLLNCRYMLLRNTSIEYVESLRIITFQLDICSYQTLKHHNYTTSVFSLHYDYIDTIDAINNSFVINGAVFPSDISLSIRFINATNITLNAYSDCLENLLLIKPKNIPSISVLYYQYIENVNYYCHANTLETHFMTSYMPKILSLTSTVYFPENLNSVYFDAIYIQTNIHIYGNHSLIVYSKKFTILSSNFYTQANFVIDTLIISYPSVNIYADMDVSTLILNTNAFGQIKLSVLKDNTSEKVIDVICQYFMASVPYITLIPSDNTKYYFNLILYNVGGTSQIVYNEDIDDLSVPFLSLPNKNFAEILNTTFVSESWPFNEGTREFELTSKIIDSDKVFSISKIKHDDTPSNSTDDPENDHSATELTIMQYIIIGSIALCLLIIIVIVVIFVRKTIYKGRLNHFISEESTMPLL